MNRIEPAAMVSEAPAMTLGELASRINTEHDRVEAAAKAGLQHARTAGEMLALTKVQVGHGRWMVWLQEHCRMSSRTAQRYILVAERWEELASKYDTVSHLTLREGLKLLADGPDDDEEVVGLTSEGQMALDYGLLDAEAARDMLRLNVIDRVATTTPFGVAGVEHRTWADLAAKRVLWRPQHARTLEDVRFAVDSELFNLEYVRVFYALADPTDAEKQADAAEKKAADSRDRLDPEAFWARMWRRLKPDFSQLTEADLAMLAEATERYLSPTFYPPAIKHQAG